MLRRFTKPIVVASQCLVRANCRADGVNVTLPFVRKLRDYARVISICPEKVLNPNDDSLRIVRRGKVERLFNKRTGEDMTQAIQQWAEQYLKSAIDADGFILKHGSRLCGVRGVKLYSSTRSDAKPEAGQPDDNKTDEGKTDEGKTDEESAAGSDAGSDQDKGPPESS